MKIILLKDVSKLGRKYDVKTVSDGHAINLLIPLGLAVAATPDALKRLEGERARTEGERKVQEELFIQNVKGLDGVTISIVSNANDKGHLFAGIHKETIAQEITKQTRLEITPSFIQLEHPLKTTGEHLVQISGAGKSATLKVLVLAK